MIPQIADGLSHLSLVGAQNAGNGYGWTMSNEIVAPQLVLAERKRRWLYMLFGLAVLYVLSAYVGIPMIWEYYARHHPSFDNNPRITQTSDGHPGDPLNVSLIGTQAEIVSTMQAARWHPAAALGLKSDLKIAADTVLSRPDDEAPVSNLFLFGRKEDLAFEQPVGGNPRKRHHVRFWKTTNNDEIGRAHV